MPNLVRFSEQIPTVPKDISIAFESYHLKYGIVLGHGEPYCIVTGRAMVEGRRLLVVVRI